MLQHVWAQRMLAGREPPKLNLPILYLGQRSLDGEVSQKKKRAKDPIHMLSIFPFSFHVSLKAKLIRQPSAGYK